MKYIGAGAAKTLQSMKPEFLSKLSYLVDNDAEKYGTFVNGVEIKPFDDLLAENKSELMIFILSEYYNLEISLQLSRMGFTENTHYMRVVDFYGNKACPSPYDEPNYWDINRDINKNSWDVRKKLLADMIPSDCKSVLDLGCGNQRLKEHLSQNVRYYPVDYISRTPDTIVCDFNKQEFPHLMVDCVFISGCLEYVYDWRWLLDNAMKACKVLVISYMIFEAISNPIRRRKAGWVNNIRFLELILYMQKNGFYLTEGYSYIIGSPLMRFERRES